MSSIEGDRIPLAQAVQEIHDIADTSNIRYQTYAHFVELIQTLLQNLDPNLTTIWEDVKRDVTIIKERLPNNKPAKQVRVACDTLLARLPSRLVTISEEVRSAIFSHLPEEEKVKLQQLSHFFKTSWTVKAAHLLHVDTIVQHAIDDTFKKAKPLRSLKKQFFLDARHAVRTLSFNKRTLSSVDLQTIVELFPNLTSLSLENCSLRDTGIAHLSRLTNLQMLTISGSRKLTGSTFNQLPLSLLKLVANSCALTDDNVGLLSRLTNLQELVIASNRSLTGSTFSQLPLSLLELGVVDCALTDDNVGLLSRLTNLQLINFTVNDRLIGSTFNQLPPSLRKLGASWGAISPAIRQQLQRERPGMSLY